MQLVPISPLSNSTSRWIKPTIWKMLFSWETNRLTREKRERERKKKKVNKQTKQIPNSTQNKSLLNLHFKIQITTKSLPDLAYVPFLCHHPKRMCLVFKINFSSFFSLKLNPNLSNTSSMPRKHGCNWEGAAPESNAT